jgi:hypothetical protein
MTRIEIDAAAWRAFRAQTIELGLTVPERLGALVRGSVKRQDRSRIRRVY